MSEMEENEVLKIYKSVGALLEGHFILSSGLHSKIYLQSALIFSDPVIAKIICKKLNLMPKFYYTGGKSGWIGDQPFVYLNTKKIRKLGWKNKFNIKESIKVTVDWLNNNQWIFKKRK